MDSHNSATQLFVRGENPNSAECVLRCGHCAQQGGEPDPDVRHELHRHSDPVSICYQVERRAAEVFLRQQQLLRHNQRG